MMPQAAKVTQSWRDLYPPHPCADVFPMMSEAELDDLANDIKAHGLLKRVVLTQGDPDEDDDKVYVLDGRNRLEALTRLGVEFPVPAKHWEPVVIGKDAREAFIVFEWRAGQIDIDPAAYVIGANIKRRHLTKEQQAELIVKTIEAGQATNDRATVARSFNPTTGQKGGSTKDPVLAKAVTEAAKHGISKRTVQTARAKLQDKPTPASVSKVPRAPRSTPTSQPADPALSEMTRLLAAKAGLPRLLDTPSDEWPALLRTLRT
jgi:hypothetical protein